jgi:hypothetical protein
MEVLYRALALPQFVWRYSGRSGGTSRDGSGTPIIVTLRHFAGTLLATLPLFYHYSDTPSTTVDSGNGVPEKLFDLL